MVRQERVRRRLRHLPINTLAPNILTVMALCAGLTSMRFALQGRWQLAVAAILIAGLLDGLDGRLARLLKGASKFGAELDSLSDVVCFGVAPAILLYVWTINTAGGVGWIVVLSYAVCCGLRLARFNTALEDPDRPAWASNYFTGLSAPVAAGVAMLPLYVAFQVGDEFVRSSAVALPWTVFVAFMMVSRIPTFAFKKVRVRRDLVLPVLLVVGLVFAALVVYPWLTLSLGTVLYLASVPFSVRSHRRLSAGWHPAAETAPAEADQTETEETADGPRTPAD